MGTRKLRMVGYIKTKTGAFDSVYYGVAYVEV
jgi:hypothetical protein